ncbi:hypothetical protein D3C72_1240370 [compost metagenome]
MARQPQGIRARIALVARVDVVEQQVIAGQAAHHVRRGEVQGVVVVEQRAQRLARIADVVLQLVVARIDIGVEVVLEGAGRGQGRACLLRAVVVARKTVALRSRVRVVQVGGGLRRAKAHVVLRQLIAEAHDDRLAIAREDDRARRNRARRVAFVTPDALRRIGRVEHPVEPLLGLQLIKQRLAEHARQLRVTLVRRPPGFAPGDVRGNRGARGQGRDCLQRGDRVGQGDQPRRGWGTGRQYWSGGTTLARSQQDRSQHGGSAQLEEGASIVYGVVGSRQATVPASQFGGFHCGPSLE